MKSTCFSLSLLICMYVLARNILSQWPCSLCSYVCNGIPGPAHPAKVKYSLRSHKLHCLFPYSYEQRENISLWEGVLVLEDHYIHSSREKKAFETEYFWPIHTYIHTSKERTSKPQKLQAFAAKSNNVFLFQLFCLSLML